MCVNITLTAGWLFLCFSPTALPVSHSQTKSSGASEDLMEGGGEKVCLSTGPEGSHYGAAGEERCPAGSQERCDQKQEDTREGCYNRAYQAEELQLK